MRINEVCKKCNLTKKAVEYYEKQGLVHPVVMDNGYREFSGEDVSRLSKIAALRGLGLSVSEIQAVLAQENLAGLKNISIKKDREIEDLRAKQELIQKLAQGYDWENIRAHLDLLEKKQSILNRLLNKFPGCYGRYISLHFAPFLGEPVTTAEQQDAFETIIAFLDGVDITIPEDLQEYLEEATKDIDASLLTDKAAENLRAAIQNPEQYLKDNRETLEWYTAFQESDEYRATPAYRLQELLKRLNRENGYNDVFIPAMQRLSKSYHEYYNALTQANGIFLKHLQSQPEQ